MEYGSGQCLAVANTTSNLPKVVNGSRKKPDDSPPSARGEPAAELLFLGSRDGEDRGRGRRRMEEKTYPADACCWCSYKLSLSLELGSTAAGVMISTTDFAQHTLKS
ncbi:Uncharacterized protein Rs2_21462 [Raphanus sativus]|nr:Uncharacterized protein Rs2_21462 [Raphanus sativus]